MRKVIMEMLNKIQFKHNTMNDHNVIKYTKAKAKQKHLTLVWRLKPHTAVAATLFMSQTERAYSL